MQYTSYHIILPESIKPSKIKVFLSKAFLIENDKS